MLSSTPLTVKPSYAFQYASAGGLFFTLDPDTGNVLAAKTCRDEIRWHWECVNPALAYYNRSDYLSVISPYIGITTGQPWDVVSFAARWEEIETTLGLTEKSVVYPTTVVGAIVLKLNPWWLKYDLRRSLVTLFMRAFVFSPTKPLDAAVDAYGLAKTIKSAIKMFMSGRTKPTFERFTRLPVGQSWVGIVNEVVGLSDDEVAAKIVPDTV